MKRKIYAGSQNVAFPILVQDTSSSIGAGLAISHSTPGLVAEYRREGQSTWTQIAPLVAGVLGTYVERGLVADGDLIGAYEFCPPNACFVAGARFVEIRLRGAANMLPVPIEVELDQVNYQDPTRFGLESLNVPGGYVSSQQSSDAIQTSLGQLHASLPANFANLLIAGNGSITVGSNLDKSGYSLGAASQNAIVAALEVEILNDATGGAVIAAIANAVAAYFDSASIDLPPQIIASAVRNNLATELGQITELAGRNEPLDASQTVSALAGSFDAIPEAVDNLLSTVHGAGLWTGGGGSGGTTGSGVYHRTFRALDSESNDAIPGAVISAEKDGELVAWGWTDSTGKLELLLDEGTHMLSYRAFGFFGDSMELDVEGSSQIPQNLALERMPSVQPPPIEGLCHVAFNCIDNSGLPLVGAYVHASLEEPNPMLAMHLVARTIPTAVTGNDGIANLVLVRSTAFIRGGVYLISVSDADGKSFHKRRVTVPNFAACNATQLIDV